MPGVRPKAPHDAASQAENTAVVPEASARTTTQMGGVPSGATSAGLDAAMDASYHAVAPPVKMAHSDDAVRLSGAPEGSDAGGMEWKTERWAAAQV